MIIVVMYRLLIAVLLFNGLTFYGTEKLPVQHVDLVVNYPVIQIVEEKVHYFNMLDTTGIFYVDDHIVYKLAAHENLKTSASIAGTEEYFVYKKGSPIGLLFKSLHETENIVQAGVDSLLYNRATTADKGNIIDSNWTPLFKERKGHELTEKYIPKALSPDPNMIDTLVFVYRDDYDRFEYSFSRRMDSAHRMKMTQLIAKQTAKLDPKLKQVFPEREFFFKLQSRQPAASDTSIIKLVERFKEHMK